MTARIVVIETRLPRRRRWLRTLAAVTVTLAAGVPATVLWWANRTFEQIPTFQTADGTAETLTPTETPKGTSTWLIFSVGSMNMSVEDANRLHVSLEGRGNDGLTDTLAVVVTHPTSTQVISIPRDTWIAAHNTRINALYNRAGIRTLADTVTELTGIPIEHAVGLNFTAYADLIDATGGIDLRFDTPIRDHGSGFEITAPGCHHLDGAAALAWTRSRKPDIHTNGRWRRNPQASDLLRIENRHNLLAATATRLATPATINKIPNLVRTAHKNLIITDTTTLNDLIDVGVTLARTGADNITYTTLPGTPTTLSSGASVVIPDLNRAATDPVINAALENLNRAPVTIDTTSTTEAADTTTTTEATGPQWGVAC